MGKRGRGRPRKQRHIDSTPLRNRARSNRTQQWSVPLGGMNLIKHNKKVAVIQTLKAQTAANDTNEERAEELHNRHVLTRCGVCVWMVCSTLATTAPARSVFSYLLLLAGTTQFFHCFPRDLYFYLYWYLSISHSLGPASGTRNVRSFRLFPFTRRH